MDTGNAKGNTIGSGGLAYGDDFENHPIQLGGATMVYEGHGNRVQRNRQELQLSVSARPQRHL